MATTCNALNLAAVLLALAVQMSAQQSPPQPEPFAPVVALGRTQIKIVLDSDGSAVPGVVVSLTSLSGTSAASAIQSFVSAADGSITVPNLAAGRYSVCIKDPKSTVIDPCSWSDSLTVLTAAASGGSNMASVRAKKASSVTVRVNDTAQALVATTATAFPPHILVGVFDGRNTFHPAREIGKDATGVTYQLAIPVDSPIRLTVYSAQVKLATATNQPVPAKGYSTIFVQPSASALTKAFSFNAVGKN